MYLLYSTIQFSITPSNISLLLFLSQLDDLAVVHSRISSALSQITFITVTYVLGVSIYILLWPTYLCKGWSSFSVFFSLRQDFPSFLNPYSLYTFFAEYSFLAVAESFACTCRHLLPFEIISTNSQIDSTFQISVFNRSSPNHFIFFLAVTLFILLPCALIVTAVVVTLFEIPRLADLPVALLMPCWGVHLTP